MIDDSQKHAVRPAGYRLGPVEDDPPDAEGPAQFGIRSLLIVQVIFAIFLTLLMATGVFAVWLAFILTVVLQWGYFRIRNIELRHIVFDLMAGVALPILCLWYDPGLFRRQDQFQVLAYLFIGFQILAMITWLSYNTLTNRPDRTLAGMLSVGFSMAMAIGIIMAPFSFFGLLFLVGLLGFTPFLTAYAFGRATRRAWQDPTNDAHSWMHYTQFALGMIIATGVPLGLYFAFGDTLATWIDRIPFPRSFLF